MNDLINLQKQMNIQAYELFDIFQNILESITKRKILITSENNEIVAYKINENQTLSKVDFAKIKNLEFTLKQSIIRKNIQSKILINNNLLYKNKVYMADILDITKNGLFVSIKQQKAFVPFSNITLYEQNSSRLKIGSQIYVVIVKKAKNNLIASRKNTLILKEIIFKTLNRQLNFFIKNDKAIIKIKKPFLDKNDMQILSNVSPYQLIFKKIKEENEI